jgi:hypothetical protein
MIEKRKKKSCFGRQLFFAVSIGSQGLKTSAKYNVLHGFKKKPDFSEKSELQFILCKMQGQ